MSGIDEQCECPLCMEPLEIDDISFYPCTCGYQICRFCWHRIRTDENGLCPACRKQYSEDPAEFKPLTDDELQRIKKERRQKDVQRKQKAAESRKHLANVRVVQRNLVFVVGLSQRLADPDQLRKPEYFGRFGKIHKVVINQSTSYAGAQGPSASAYVTYCRSSDALKAILNVNNVHIDGRTLKASLGTTKYCSHFLKGTQCQKVDCMYLHELGEEAASFTKEEMQMGKHQEYEQKLLQQFQNSQNVNNHKQTKKVSSPVTVTPPVEAPSQQQAAAPPPPPPATEETNDGHTCWPVLKQPVPESKATPRAYTPPSIQPTQTTVTTTNSRHRSISDHNAPRNPSPPQANDEQTPPPDPSPSPPHPQLSPPRGAAVPDTQLPPPPLVNIATSANRRSLVFDNSNSHSLSLFSGDGFTPRLLVNGPQGPQTTVPTETVANPSIPDTLNVSSTTDWQAAFGFTNTKDSQDEDLGFDPLEESAKGLADLLQKERVGMNHKHSQPPPPHAWPPPHMSNFPFAAATAHPPQMPPGFNHAYTNPNHMLPSNPLLRHELNMNGSRMMGLMNVAPAPHTNVAHKLHPFTQPPHTTETDTQNDVFSTKDWQDGLRALLPNINISFGPPTPHSNQYSTHSGGPDAWVKQMPPPPHPFSDINDTQLTANHRLPFVQQFSLRGATWPPQTRNPPPGFQTMPPTHNTEPHVVTDPLQ